MEEQFQHEENEVVIPSSPQVELEKKAKTVKTSCCMKLSVFLCLFVMLAAIMVTVVYVGFWVHIYDTEDPGLLVMTGKETGANYSTNNTFLMSLTEGRDACDYITSYPISLKGAVATVFNKRVKVCGGMDTAGRHLRDCYSLNEGWDYYINLGTTRAFAAAVSVPEEGWWITGGESDDRELLYSTEILHIEGSEKFDEGPKLPQPMSRHCAVKLKDSKFMIIGGQTRSSNFSGRAWLMTYSSKRPWIPKSDLHYPRHSHSCVWDGTRVIVAGGITKEGPTSVVESFDPNDHKWVTLDPLPFAFFGATSLDWLGTPSLIVDGKVLKWTAYTWKLSTVRFDQRSRYGLAVIAKLDWICL